MLPFMSVGQSIKDVVWCQCPICAKRGLQAKLW